MSNVVDIKERLQLNSEKKRIENSKISQECNPETLQKKVLSQNVQIFQLKHELANTKNRLTLLKRKLERIESFAFRGTEEGLK